MGGPRLTDADHSFQTPSPASENEGDPGTTEFGDFFSLKGNNFKQNNIFKLILEIKRGERERDIDLLSRIYAFMGWFLHVP